MNLTNTSNNTKHFFKVNISLFSKNIVNEVSKMYTYINKMNIYKANKFSSITQNCPSNTEKITPYT